jgi:hypothetical protein
MTIQELVRRFPEVPRDLHDEPLLEQFAEAFGDLLQVAQNPSNCSAQYEATHHYYLKLIGPLNSICTDCQAVKVRKQLQETRPLSC